MTACTNHGGKARRVVTAALVGVLSVGTVPMAALATGVSDGIETLALDENAIAGGEVVYRNGEDGETFVYSGKKQGLVPTTLTPKGGSSAKRLQLLPSSGSIEAGYYYFYVDMSGTDAVQTDPNGLSGVSYVNTDGIKTLLKGSILREQPTEVGNYAVVAGYWNGTNDWDVVSIADTFKIAPMSLEGATIFEGNDMSDTTFAFTGKAGSNTATDLAKTIGVAVDGVRLEAGTDVEVTILDATTGQAPADGIVYPGQKYVAHIEGKNDAYKGEAADVTFEYGLLNFADAVIDGNVIKTSDGIVNPEGHVYTDAELIAAINGFAGSDLYDNADGTGGNEWTIEYVSSPDGVQWSTKQGVYTFKIKAKPGAKYCTGEKTFSVTLANIPLTINLSGCGSDVDGDGCFDVDLSDDKPTYFDPSKATFTDRTPEKLDVTVTKADGTSATVDDLKTPGTYYVSYSVYYTEADGDLVAGNKTAKVCVYYSVAEDADVFFTFDGENVESNNAAAPAEVTYSGEDFAPLMSVKVYGGDTELTEGTDYTVTWQRQQANGAWADVDSVVDAGDYRIVVSPVGSAINLTGGDGVCYLTVKQMELTPVVNGTVTKRIWSGDTYTNGDTFVPYTGSEQNVTFSFVNADGEPVELSDSAYEVLFTYRDKTKEVAVKDVANYDAHFSDTAEAGNYTVEGDLVPFTVKEAKSFSDVATGKWYVGPVFQAKENGYVNGISGTSMFAPESEISRKDAVCIIFNMAGGDSWDGEGDFAYTENGGWYTGFGDCDGNAYYAKALAWAHNLGIANGSNGSFRPDDRITREELASMLANYAKVTGDYVASDGSALAALPDASSVSGWATENVAWAVENGIMGNGGLVNAGANITRAEVAAMAVNYQPTPAV